MSEVLAWINQTVTQYPVVIFMKGTADNPMCRFSKSAVQVLKDCGAENITSVNVLESDVVRQGIKDYSNWPTLPQVYINGEFVGGADILSEMQRTGELQSLLSS